MLGLLVCVLAGCVQENSGDAGNSGPVLRGRVTDVLSGEPIGGVFVGTEFAETLTDNEGRFEVPVATTPLIVTWDRGGEGTGDAETAYAATAICDLEAPLELPYRRAQAPSSMLVQLSVIPPAWASYSATVAYEYAAPYPQSFRHGLVTVSTEASEGTLVVPVPLDVAHWWLQLMATTSSGAVHLIEVREGTTATFPESISFQPEVNPVQHEMTVQSPWSSGFFEIRFSPPGYENVAFPGFRAGEFYLRSSDTFLLEVVVAPRAIPLSFHLRVGSSRGPSAETSAPFLIPVFELATVSRAQFGDVGLFVLPEGTPLDAPPNLGAPNGDPTHVRYSVRSTPAALIQKAWEFRAQVPCLELPDRQLAVSWPERISEVEVRIATENAERFDVIPAAFETIVGCGGVTCVGSLICVEEECVPLDDQLPQITRLNLNYEMSTMVACWASERAQNCLLDAGGGLGNVAISGCIPLLASPPLTVTLECRNEFGVVSESTSI